MKNTQYKANICAIDLLLLFCYTEKKDFHNEKCRFQYFTKVHLPNDKYEPKHNIVEMRLTHVAKRRKN